MPHPLDNPAWHALTTTQESFALTTPLARRYSDDVSPIAAVRESTPAAFADLRTLLTPGQPAALLSPQPLQLPCDFELVMTRPLDQMTCPRLALPTKIIPLPLTPADVPEMLALTAATEPGPFLPNTIRMGHYVGLRSPDTGKLIAMAGQRMTLPLYTEISAVCTDPDHRGQGHAQSLVAHLAAQIHRENKTPFLHVVPENTAAKSVYQKLGFTVRRTLQLTLLAPR